MLQVQIGHNSSQEYIYLGLPDITVTAIQFWIIATSPYLVSLYHWTHSCGEYVDQSIFPLGKLEKTPQRCHHPQNVVHITWYVPEQCFGRSFQSANDPSGIRLKNQNISHYSLDKHESGSHSAVRYQAIDSLYNNRNSAIRYHKQE